MIDKRALALDALRLARLRAVFDRSPAMLSRLAALERLTNQPADLFGPLTAKELGKCQSRI